MRSEIFLPCDSLHLWSTPIESPPFIHKESPQAECVSHESDAQTVFRCFTLADLRRLASAFQKGLVVTGRYAGGNGRGCLLYHLNHAIKDLDSHATYFASDPEAYAASKRLVIAWDSGRLSAGTVRSLLEHAIADRAKVNDAEEQTIRPVHFALASRPALRTQGKPTVEPIPPPASISTRGAREPAYGPVLQMALKEPPSNRGL